VGTGPRIRCIGRTDDLLIVRGVNPFPGAIRAVLNDFLPEVGTMFQIRPRYGGVVQSPPLPAPVELAQDIDREPEGLRQRLARGEYKSRLVDYSCSEKQ
jgi:phenylacetate-CoA ligase